ncbi:SRPBCC family protein [Brachybacterium huguangmaarense]|uniref:SRPBCC family protein n=1 Tax=Brachybacterium huguangmaarense TaxID=1652028 RepID=A0ABY6G2C6_9MICO|nr:SRPBCC family protein [Brachybacterium huguangmaarense]UYG17348.1 SRPBCC family protein [Brachybacterium huguangmaarense]
MTSTENSITVTRTIDVPAKDVFALLTLPARHREFDGSGMVRSSEDTERITKVGEQFVMNMHAEDMGGDYRMYNHVTAFDHNKMVGWQPAQEQNKDQPAGWEWLYELTPLDSGDTEVSLTYDWSKVTDPKLRQIFPKVTEEDLEQSLNLLAAAVTAS